MRVILAVLVLAVLGVLAVVMLLYLAGQTERGEGPLAEGGNSPGQGAGNWRGSSDDGDTYTIERTEYHNPPPKQEELTDDRLEDKPPLPFLPQLVDRRPLGKDDAWLVNSSAALLRLDVPIIHPDYEGALLELHPSYAAAVKNRHNVLPSVNLLDGKCKQFDDGLYAALDQAYYKGLKDRLRSHVDVIKQLYEKTDKASEAAAFLAAGLELADVRVEVKNAELKDRYVREFQQSAAAKPIGFYTWNDMLQQCWKFMKFFQHEFGPHELAVPTALSAILSKDTGLRADYERINSFYARLTNPLLCLPLTGLPEAPLTAEAFKQLCRERKVHRATVAVLPPSTSRETVLFDRLFPAGLPADANLMNEFIRRIRSGEVDLTPRPSSGWYDHQVYALETMLLPERGDERNKLYLTKQYKKRMLEAFQALVTKRRETHSRQLGVTKDEAMPPPELPEFVQPRLRVEPCPSFFLRTARAYAFLAGFLEAALGKDALTQLKGLREGGEREADLFTELQQMRDLFYGLYLISCEDIGQPINLAKDEAVDPEKCYHLASKWLPGAFRDADMAADTRVSIPLYADSARNVTRLWLTLGVRLAKLDVNYMRPPSLKPARGEGEWNPVEGRRLLPSNYLIAVDEFAEVELRGVRTLDRSELRAICDREKTREKIIAALSR